jgi:hypothetical protein
MKEKCELRTKLLEECDTFQDLCMVSVRSLKGEIPLLGMAVNVMVGDNNKFDNGGLEHDSLIVASINENGFYTTCSQLGEFHVPKGESVPNGFQHQFVSGVVTNSTFDKLVKALDDPKYYPKQLPQYVTQLTRADGFVGDSTRPQFRVVGSEKSYPYTCIKLPAMLQSGYTVIKHNCGEDNLWALEANINRGIKWCEKQKAEGIQVDREYIDDLRKDLARLRDGNELHIGVTIYENVSHTSVSTEIDDMFDLPNGVLSEEVMEECVGISIVDFIPGRNDLLPILDTLMKSFK